MSQYLAITYKHPLVNFASFVDYLEYLMHYNIFVLFLLYFTMALKDHYYYKESFLDLTQLQASWCYKHLELENLNESLFTDYLLHAPPCTQSYGDE